MYGCITKLYTEIFDKKNLIKLTMIIYIQHYLYNKQFIKYNNNLYKIINNIYLYR